MSDHEQSAVERAEAYGIDVTLLMASLRLTPIERVRRAEAFINIAISIREQGRKWREAQAAERKLAE